MVHAINQVHYLLSMCFEVFSNKLLLFCPQDHSTALRNLALSRNLSVHLVGVRTKATKKSLVSVQAGCVYCNTEVHRGQSLQILSDLHSSPFAISNDTAFGFNTDRIKMRAFPNSP